MTTAPTIVCLEHRHAEPCPHAGSSTVATTERLALAVQLVRREVVDMDGATCGHELPSRAPMHRLPAALSQVGGKGLRHVAERAAVRTPHPRRKSTPQARRADADRILQQRADTGSRSAGERLMTAARRLSPSGAQRLGQLAGALLDLALEAGRFLELPRHAVEALRQRFELVARYGPRCDARSSSPSRAAPAYESADRHHHAGAP